MIDRTAPDRSVWHRALLAMVAVAFLLPGPARMPADEVRASYAALGMLCAPDSDGTSHREAHCVLCLLPAAATPEGIEAVAPVLAWRVDAVFTASSRFIAARTATPNARAPPSSII